MSAYEASADEELLLVMSQNIEKQLKGLEPQEEEEEEEEGEGDAVWLLGRGVSAFPETEPWADTALGVFLAPVTEFGDVFILLCPGCSLSPLIVCSR